MYRISTEKIDNIKPSIPDNYFTRNGYEDNKIKRICFSNSIDGCIMGISYNCTGKEFYVYQPISIDKTKIIYPTKDQVPDCKVTGEIWYLKETKLKCIGKIKVIKPKGKDITFKYGKDKYGITGKWEWKWIEKYHNNIADFIKEVQFK